MKESEREALQPLTSFEGLRHWYAGPPRENWGLPLLIAERCSGWRTRPNVEEVRGWIRSEGPLDDRAIATLTTLLEEVGTPGQMRDLMQNEGWSYYEVARWFTRAGIQRANLVEWMNRFAEDR